jgi:nucleoid-associated protein YgaU
MGLLTFIKEAGEKLFGKRDAQAAPAAPSAPAASDPAAANRAAADAILAYVKAQNLPTIAITVTFDGASGTVKVAGSVPDQESKEKILLCCGNVAGVEHVEEEVLVETVEPEAEFYTVQKGDNLSKISKMHYGDPNKYMAIFEANKPMLKHPDKIYPGQMLRIPPL